METITIMYTYQSKTRSLGGGGGFRRWTRVNAAKFNGSVFGLLREGLTVVDSMGASSKRMVRVDKKA